MSLMPIMLRAAGGEPDSLQDSPARVRAAFRLLEWTRRTEEGSKAGDGRGLNKDEAMAHRAACETVKMFVTGEDSCLPVNPMPESGEPQQLTVAELARQLLSTGLPAPMLIDALQIEAARLGQVPDCVSNGQR